MIVRICASPLPRQRREIFFLNPRLTSRTYFSRTCKRAHTRHTRHTTPQEGTRLSDILYKQAACCSFARNTNDGRWDLAGTGLEDRIRQAARSTWPWVRSDDVALRSDIRAGPRPDSQPIQPMPDRPAIHPFTRPSVARGAGEVAQLMHRVLRVINAPSPGTLQPAQPTYVVPRLVLHTSRGPSIHTYSTRHLGSTRCSAYRPQQYLPALAGASIFVHYAISTCYEIGRDGEGTHHAGDFQNGPISLQLPVLHMQSTWAASSVG